MESLKTSSNIFVNSTGSYQDKQTCLLLPPKINSLGLSKFFVEGQEDDMLGYLMPNIQLQMAVIFCITQAFHFGLKRLGFSALISQILVNSMIFSFLYFELLPVSLLRGFTEMHALYFTLYIACTRIKMQPQSMQYHQIWFTRKRKTCHMNANLIDYVFVFLNPLSRLDNV